jgi:hypothetical protein
MRIEPRFCGPPGSGNGGYTAGRVASLIAGSAEVTLRAPPPLATELALEARGEGAVLLAPDGSTVAEGQPREFELSLPEAVGWEEAQAATPHYIGFREHPYPGCFVCGPRRSEASGSGLGLFPGAARTASGQSVVAAPFAPPREFCSPTDSDLRSGAQGRASTLLRPEFIWAALDCPSWFGHAAFVEPVPKILLGRLSVHIERRPRADERCVVVGWGMGQEGRRITCGSALYDANGECLARAKAIWVELKSP